MSSTNVTGSLAPETAAAAPEMDVKQVLEGSKQEPQAEQDKFGPKFAALSRKEKEIRQREQQYQESMKKYEAEKSELQKWREEKEKGESAIQRELRENPLKFMEKHGISFEELTKMQLNEQNPTPEMLIKRTREELESGYKQELAELRKAMKDKEEQEETKKYEQTVSGFKSQINDFVEANADTYELIKINNAQDLIFDVISEYYEQNGRILSIEDAAKFTEEELEVEARKVLEAKRFKQPARKEEPSQEKTTPTLSNALSSEAPHQGEQKLSREESLARAAKMLRWNT